MELERALNSSKSVNQYRLIRDYIKQNTNIKDYHYLSKIIKSIEIDNNKNIKTAVLSSFNFDQLKEILTVETFKYGMSNDIYLSGYNQYRQEILNNESPFYSFKPDITILAVAIDELIDNFSEIFLNISKNDLDRRLQEIIDLFSNLIKSIRSQIQSKIIINNFNYPFLLKPEIYDFQNINGQTEWIKRLNSALVNLVAQFEDVYIFDINHYTSYFGAKSSYDTRMWFVAKIPYKIDFISFIAKKYSQYIKSTFEKRKCLVLDLDNTIWGGIVGEDGLKGIQLGNDFPGNVYCEIQKKIKNFSKQGIILTINSKNNLSDVMEVFENHPHMILQWNDFAAARINWNSKHQNMLELANELNIGIDSMVFIDDSQFEIQMVNNIYPEIDFIQFCNNPIDNLEMLQELDSFITLSLTEEDLNKKDQYNAQVNRIKFKNRVLDIEDYYHGLNMKIKINECDSFNIPRVSQLTQKTNQFNLTTQRYSEIDIEKFCNSKSSRVYTLSVEDRFGDNGLTGVMIINLEKQKWEIDTFLLSCRIIGRTIETGFLSFILDQARANSVKEIIGQYFPNDKNSQVKELFKDHGFSLKNNLWILKTHQIIEFPAWIELI